MHFHFHMSYRQDLRLFKEPSAVFSYGLLGVLLVAAPFFLPDYVLGQLTLISIFAVVGVGLVLLTGLSGQLSFGHGAFMAVGAYAAAIVAAQGIPFPLGILAGGALAAVFGAIVGWPVSRLTGIYLAIGTLAFSFIIEEGIVRWEGLTGGNGGKYVKPLAVGRTTFNDETSLYVTAVATLALSVLLLLNLTRSAAGRAFISIRDSEVAARTMGVNVGAYKTLAFALSAALAGVGGALYAHKIRYLSPEQFGVGLSIELLILLFVGGVRSPRGAILGAAFVVAIPQLIATMKDWLPEWIAAKAGLQPILFGAALIVVILFEPQGLNGRWIKVRTFFEEFPLYKKGQFKRQKAYLKSERMR